MLLCLYKRLGHTSKAVSFQSLFSYKSLSLRLHSPSFSSMSRDRLLVGDTKKLVISPAKLKESGKENIKKELESAFKLLMESGKDFNEIIRVFHHMSENLSHLKFSSTNIHANNQHLKFIIDKAIEVLKKDFSSINLEEFMRFCEFFEIDDPLVYKKISKIILDNKDKNLPLIARLELMADFDRLPSIVEDKEVESVSSLSLIDYIHFLYLTKVKGSSFITNEETHVQINIPEIERKLLEAINPKSLRDIPDRLSMLLVTLLHIRDKEVGDRELLQSKISIVEDVLAQNLSRLSTKELIQLYHELHHNESSWSTAERLVQGIVSLLEERMQKTSLKDISNLVMCMHKYKERKNFPPFIQEANELLIRSIVTTVLPDKSKSSDIGYPLLVATQKLCWQWGVWDDVISETICTVMTALYEVKRISSNTYIKLLQHVNILNKGHVPELCLALLRLRSQEFITNTNLFKLTQLYELLKNNKDTARQYELALIQRVSDAIRNKDPAVLSTNMNERMFEFIVRNLSLFDSQIVDLYTGVLEESIHELSEQELITYHFKLMTYLNLETLIEGKAQDLLYLFEKEIETNINNMSPKAQKSYISHMIRFLGMIDPLKKSRKELQIIDTRDYTLRMPSKKFKIPMNVSLLNKLLKEEIQSGLVNPKDQTNLGSALAIIASIAPQQTMENYNQSLDSIWEKFEKGETSFYTLSEIFRSNHTVRTIFKEKFIDKNQKVREILLEGLYKEFEKDFSVLSREIIITNKTRSVVYHIFNMANFILSWKLEDDWFKTKFRAFIDKNLDNFNLYDMTAVTSFGNSILREERIALYNVVKARLGTLLVNEPPDSKLAYSLLMSFNLDQIEDKTAFELEKLIANDFLKFKVHEITKLIQKYERIHRKSSKILWCIIKYYFRPESILHLTPLHVNTFTKALLTGNYGEITPFIKEYLEKKKEGIRIDYNLSELFFELTSMCSAQPPQDFLTLYEGTLEGLLSVSNPKCYMLLIASLEIFRQKQIRTNINFTSSQLSKKWESLLDRTDLEQLVHLATTFDLVMRKVDLLGAYPWLSEKLLEETSKYKEDPRYQKSLVQIISCLHHDAETIKRNTERVNECIATFFHERLDIETISKFALAWFTGFKDNNTKDKDIIGKIRTKILSVNPSHYYSSQSLLNLLEIFTIYKNSEQSNSWFFTMKDYKLLNRIEDVIILRAFAFSKEELAVLYKTYAEKGLGSNRILEFLEQKVL